MTTRRTAHRNRNASRISAFACAVACVVALFAGGLEGGRTTAAPAHHSVSTDADEYELKAAFLYNFARYAKWPDGAFETKTSPLVIAVVGKDPFGKRLEKTLGDKRVGRHPIVIRRYERAKDIEDAHLLFLGKMSKKERRASVERVKKRPVLVVADEGGVTATGAAIGFYLDRKRIRFEVSVEALERTKLRLSSKLLKLARIVRPEKSPGGSSDESPKEDAAKDAEKSSKDDADEGADR